MTSAYEIMLMRRLEFIHHFLVQRNRAREQIEFMRK
jgi:hypothetical protein